MPETDDPRVAVARKYLERLKPITTVPINMEENPPRDFSYKAVLFDIYGTMLTSRAVSDEHRATAIAEICAEVFPDLSPPSSHCCHRIKNTFYQHLTYSYNSLKMKEGRTSEVDFRNIWAQVLQKELSLGKGEYLQQVELFALLYAVTTHLTWPQPGLLDTIKGLAAKNIPMGVISNSQFYTPITVNYFLGCEVTFSSYVIPYFFKELTFYSFQHGYVKPEDYFFLEAKEQLADKGINPNETLYVGNDYRNDIDSANRNGFRSVLYAGDQTTCRANHPNAKPDFVVKDLRHIL